MTFPELLPPPGFYRIDEAYRRWMDMKFGDAALTHVKLEWTCCNSVEEREAVAARFANIDDARHEFILGLRERRQSVNVISPNGTRHEIPDTAWDAGEFPDLLALYKTIPAHAPKPFGSYAGGIVVVASTALDEWARGNAPVATNAKLSSQERVPAETPAPRLSTSELEDAYKKRVKNWPADRKTPSLMQDWEFLKSLHPSLPRIRARQIRQALAPSNWTRPGRSQSRQ